ncbi:aminoglycoside phosphotransferase family protein [Paenibacillus aestuarii]|uniref:Aminoglycoside phosphotransferase family protein n=1 Tax=Paenibacillus aestuarii TaxID=516965 RepID=A0ABW0K8I8_9BACL|nr:aminoglycoside phosphotransferase family protein [Paenibacillus aestuarii]
MEPVSRVDIDAALVRRLIDEQFPQWMDLPLEHVDSAGTDNAIYRLGAELAVRLPRVDWALGQVEKEQRWLPLLAPALPVPIPVPLAMGAPAAVFPWPWSVYPWLEGENATIEPVADLHHAATVLADFISALQRIDAAGGPPPGPHNSNRGVELAARDNAVREAIAALREELDADAVGAAWEAALYAPVWSGAPVWLHGDLHPGNVLVEHGRLSAVIDFGTLGVGDPACDVMAGWTLLDADARVSFRAALPVDDATWVRGSGWALSFGLIAYAYYKHTNPVLAGISKRAIDEVMADFMRGR